MFQEQVLGKLMGIEAAKASVDFLVSIAGIVARCGYVEFEMY